MLNMFKENKQLKIKLRNLKRDLSQKTGECEAYKKLYYEMRDTKIKELLYEFTRTSKTNNK